MTPISDHVKDCLQLKRSTQELLKLQAEEGKLQAEVVKLGVETSKLERDHAWWWRILPTLGPVVAALVTYFLISQYTRSMEVVEFTYRLMQATPKEAADFARALRKAREGGLLDDTTYGLLSETMLSRANEAHDAAKSRVGSERADLMRASEELTLSADFGSHEKVSTGLEKLAAPEVFLYVGKKQFRYAELARAILHRAGYRAPDRPATTEKRDRPTKRTVYYYYEDDHDEAKMIASLVGADPKPGSGTVRRRHFELWFEADPRRSAGFVKEVCAPLSPSVRCRADTIEADTDLPGGFQSLDAEEICRNSVRDDQPPCVYAPAQIALPVFWRVLGPGSTPERPAAHCRCVRSQ